MPIKGPVPTPKTTVTHSFRLTFRRRRMASFLLLFISRAWDELVNTNINELDGSESKWSLKVDQWIRNIHLQHQCQLFASERNRSWSNAALKLKKFFSAKIPILDKLKSDEFKLTLFPFDRLDDNSLCLCNLWGKEQLPVELPNDFSAKIIVPHDTADSFDVAVKSYLFGLLRELLYGNEAQEHSPSGTFAALNAKEYVLATETNTASGPIYTTRFSSVLSCKDLLNRDLIFLNFFFYRKNSILAYLCFFLAIDKSSGILNIGLLQLRDKLE